MIASRIVISTPLIHSVILQIDIPSNYYQAAHLLIFQQYLLHLDAGLWPGRPEGQHYPGNKGGIPPLHPLLDLAAAKDPDPILYRWQLILKS